MNLLTDLGALVSKYAAPLMTYVYSFAGLTAANATGNLSVGLSSGAVAALFPAAVHLAHDIANDIKGVVADAKSVESAAQDSVK